MTTKRDWHEQVEQERLPANEIHEKSDGKTIRVEYREENGLIYKTTKTYQKEKLSVLPIVAERRKWKKFGDAADDPPGINTTTTTVADEVIMQFISSKEDDEEEEEIIRGAMATIRGIQCHNCKGDHWTARCPYKDKFQSTIAQSVDKKNDTMITMTSSNGIDGGPSVGKWFSQRVRRGNPDTAYSSDRAGSSRGPPYGSSGRSNDLRNQDEATVRVSNLPEEMQEQDLRDLFGPIGPVTRIYLGKNETSKTSKGFAFISFKKREDAQKAIDCISGFGYDHLILKVEWSTKKPQN